jgi:hypothetical protein
MVFWIAILAGIGFVWLAVRLGFYETWILFFNVLVSMYLGIFLTPMIVSFAPASGEVASYGVALSMVVLAGGCFAILQGLSYVFLTGQFSISFPRLFDIPLSGLLGFVAGFLALSFAALTVTTTPLARHRIVSTLGFNRQSQQATITCIAWGCDLIHAFARFEAGEGGTQEAVNRLLDLSGDIRPASPEPRPEPNAPESVQKRSVRPRRDPAAGFDDRSPSP